MILIVNRETEQMIMGEESQQATDELIWLRDLVVVAIVPGQRGPSPLPHSYPGMFSKNFVKDKVLNEREYSFKKADWAIFKEDELADQAIDMYKDQMTERAGLVRATSIPSDIRIVNG